MTDRIKNAVTDYGRKIKGAAYMLRGDSVKLVINTAKRTYGAVLTVNGRSCADAFNEEEPFDRLTHVFYVPSSELKPETELTLEFKRTKKISPVFRCRFLFGEPVFPTQTELLAKYDNGLKLLYEEKEDICGAAEYCHKLYNDKKGAPVHAFVLKFRPDKAGIYVGTPNDGYESVNVRATIPDMISAARKNGRNIIAAVNADFFDMFGDYHPSGLCVKNGRTTANPKSRRPFIATLKDGGHIITDLTESPGIAGNILHAASGMQLIVKDGEIFDYAPLEPFGYTRHPRTAAGVAKDGTVILAVVDGRIPDYSNGASLVDLAKLMLENGADRAVNLDGGGSSAVYTKKDGGFLLRSRPADLVRPNAMLIRKDYNSLLVEKY